MKNQPLSQTGSGRGFFFLGGKMNELSLFEQNEKWYTIDELASMSGIAVETLKGGHSPLNELSIGIETETQMGGYHNTQKFYSEKVLKALKQYQLRNAVPNAMKNKETAIEGNVSVIQTATVQCMIEKLMDNPDTLQLMLTESLKRNQILTQRAEIAESALARIENGKGCFTMNQTAKALKLPYGNITLFQKLRENGILNSDNTPKQEQINAGRFKVVVKVVENVGNRNVTLTTGKGLVYLAKRFNTEIDESVKADA